MDSVELARWGNFLLYVAVLVPLVFVGTLLLLGIQTTLRDPISGRPKWLDIGVYLLLALLGPIGWAIVACLLVSTGWYVRRFALGDLRATTVGWWAEREGLVELDREGRLVEEPPKGSPAG